jgi:hypothetical protein
MSNPAESTALSLKRIQTLLERIEFNTRQNPTPSATERRSIGKAEGREGRKR